MDDRYVYPGDPVCYSLEAFILQHGADVLRRQ